MSTITGGQLVAWVESKTNNMLLEARTELRTMISTRLRQAIPSMHEVVADNLASQLAKSTDFKGPESWANFPELTELLQSQPELRERLAREFLDLKRDEHFNKTRVSYVRTVLRPFLRHWLTRMSREVEYLDIQRLTDESSRLRAEQIADKSDLDHWTRRAYDLFEEYVVWKNPEGLRSAPSGFNQRPSGLVNPRSVRTYRQAWFAFFDRHGDEIFSPDFVARDDQSFEDLPLSITNFSMARSEPIRGFSQAARPNYYESAPMKRPDLTFYQDGFQVLVDLKASGAAGLEASRKWLSAEALDQSLEAWLKNFPAIWGDAAKQVSAIVQITDSSGESKLELPAMPIEQLPSKIKLAINSLKP